MLQEHEFLFTPYSYGLVVAGAGEKPTVQAEHHRPHPTGVTGEGQDETGSTKSRAGKRGIGLPDPLIELLKQHRDQQQRERELAADLWRETDYVFTTPTGGPLNPRTDYTEWKRLLEDANVPERRLHDARHTAATVLLLLGVPDRTVMG